MAASDEVGFVREAGKTRLEYAVPRGVGEGLHLARLFLLLFFAVVVVRTAWMGDDAFITLRTVDNFVHGHGLRWNIAERVNANTHPLWMFAEAAFVSPFSRSRLPSAGGRTCHEHTHATVTCQSRPPRAARRLRQIVRL